MFCALAYIESCAFGAGPLLSAAVITVYCYRWAKTAGQKPAS
jgi:hypothetical protein